MSCHGPGSGSGARCAVPVSSGLKGAQITVADETWHMEYKDGRVQWSCPGDGGQSAKVQSEVLFDDFGQTPSPTEDMMLYQSFSEVTLQSQRLAPMMPKTDPRAMDRSPTR